MELLDAKCPNCGGMLKLNPSMNIGECIYCHSQIIVKDAIDVFQKEINVLWARAKQAEDYKDVDLALKLYKQIIEKQPESAKAHFELFEIKYSIAKYYYYMNSGMQRAIYEYARDLEDAIKHGIQAVEYATDDEKIIYTEAVDKAIENLNSVIKEIEHRENPKSWWKIF